MSVLTVFVNLLVLLTISDAMTMKQIRSTGKMMRKSCQPKNNVEDACHWRLRDGTYGVEKVKSEKEKIRNSHSEKIDHINDGVFNEEREVMCYIACIMKMANAIKNGKLNYESAMKQADLLLPEEIKEPAKAAITACRKVSDSYKDICEASFHVTKCIYTENPAAFYFP